MDQDKFDQHLMDFLFDELDEVTSAAMKRQIEADGSCRELVLGMRATLEVAQVPMEEPSDDLEERILAAAALAEDGEPWTRKLLRGLAWAGSHAMRPQLAMAAMLVLVVGSSLLLLRVRTGAVAVTPTKDDGTTLVDPTRQGPAPPATQDDGVPTLAPLAQNESSTAKPEASSAAQPAPARPSAPGPRLSEEQLALIDKRFDAAMASYNSGNHLVAQRQFAEIKATQSPRAASSALYEARAVRAHSGCKAAISYYNAVRGLGGSVTADATYEQADCHRILGEPAQARALWLALRDNRSYGARAAKELESQGEVANRGGDGSSLRQRNAMAPPKAAAAAKGEPAPAAKPQSERNAKQEGNDATDAPKKVAAPPDTAQDKPSAPEPPANQRKAPSEASD